MAASNFQAALKHVLKHEGGYVNHKDDPGGETNFGITIAVYRGFRERKGLAARSVKAISQAEVAEIYRNQYWHTIHADDLPDGVDYCLFDYAVNSGPGRAAKDVQRALGVKVDGVIGMNTLTATKAADDAKLINDVCDRRMRFLKSLRTWKTFGKGWTRRVEGVRAAALAMVEGASDVVLTKAPLPAPPGPAAVAAMAVKAPEAQQAQLKTAEGAGLSITACGVGGEKVRQFAESVQPHMGMESMLGRLAFAAFTILMLLGGALVAWSYIGRIKEKGGLGGYIGSVFKGS